MKTKEEIGIVTTTYKKDGSVEAAFFEPTIRLKASQELLTSLLKLKTEHDLPAVQRNAQTIFATWFEKTNEIELADREKFEIATEVISCERYPDGKIKTCKIRFVFKSID